MAASSIRRARDYAPAGGGGGGGTVTAAVAAKPTKTLTPVSTLEALKRSTGKENPRPTSRGRAATAQKPAMIRPMPRIDKSTSSVPRGRCSSPSDFNRVLSDLRKDARVSRVSASGVEAEQRSVSSGRRSVIQQKKVSLRDLDAKSSGGSENRVRLLTERRNSVFSEVGSERRAEISERIQQKKGSLGDLDAKSSGGSENRNRLSHECRNSAVGEVGNERRGEISEQCGSNSKGSEEVRGRVLERIQQQIGGLRDLNAKSSEGSEKVVKEWQNSVNADVAMEKKCQSHEQSEFYTHSGEEASVRVPSRIQQRKGGLKDLDVKSSGGSVNGVGGLKECANSVNAEVGMEKSGQNHKQCQLSTKGGEEARVRVSDELKGDGNLNTIPAKSCLGSHDSKRIVDSNLKVSSGLRVYEESKGRSSADLKSVSGGEVGGKELGRKTLNGSRGSEISKAKCVVEEVMGGGSINKYPSRLHEKLAFLEGKVKRIASDIKKTKEMLDKNNPDASKVILSDIQQKISGIEKAMESVNGVDGKIGVPKVTETDDVLSKSSDKSQNKEVDPLKCSVKGLNSEELEARLFPHQMLIRDRTSSKVSSNHQSDPVEPSFVSKPEEKLLGSNDENSIALEFLASLNNEQSKITRRAEIGGVEFTEVQETDGVVNSTEQDSSKTGSGEGGFEMILTTDEKLDDFDDQENRPAMTVDEEIDDSLIYQLNEIGHKTATGGWFVSEGEAVLLAHGDGSCSFYDIINCEDKAEYKPPVEVSHNLWRDCWIIRAPGADGCSGRYVVAASAGNTSDSGFCSWDFYSKDVRAFHTEDGIANYSRTALAPLPNNTIYRRNTLSSVMAPENHQWWYRPCGPLIVSTASCQKAVKVYDIRDGEQIMKWEVQRPVLAMNYSSPLQWRSRGKVVVAESESVSLWDVSSLDSQALLSISSCGRKVSALHVNNSDAEPGGGVRQRVSSSEAEGNDGVFCTPDSINVLDFRHPSGVGLKIPKLGVNATSVFSRGDSIFIGCNNARSSGMKQPCPQVQQFSLRKQKLFGTYSLPESNAHSHYTALTQVWGNPNHVMGVCGLGLFVFDASNDDGLQQSLSTDCSNLQKVKEVIGPDDLYSPSFDYSGSRVLLISRDRPALWRYLS
ncbi:KIN14B-interacting protein At4g14310 isoform X2 [Rhododendron vialii]|uniref:KIN14B-interacting protein At4g14310 isoform X2 n=1 Tax=Rhododendron vialii TaxID=182163 RepID=UPI0026603B48|nr:KIN14B-interacting protein At4g14310 isoform X2 [Rhododendron vialii]